MSSLATYRALVVDDEPMVRQLTTRALSRIGFICEPAANGREAIELAKQTSYDLVVSDLQMPEANGHKLAIDLLALPRRPVVLIVTGIIEPKISSDLRARGVDDVLYKPVEFGALAKQALALVEERAAARHNDRSALAKAVPQADAPTSSETRPIAPIPPNRSTEPTVPVQQIAQSPPIATEVCKITDALRIPPQDFDGFEKASGNAFNAKKLASAIQTDPSFALEVLRMLNSVMYNSNQTLAELRHSTNALQQGTPIKLMAIFAGGMLLGCLMSVLGAGAWLMR